MVGWTYDRYNGRLMSSSMSSMGEHRLGCTHQIAATRLAFGTYPNSRQYINPLPQGNPPGRSNYALLFCGTCLQASFTSTLRSTLPVGNRRQKFVRFPVLLAGVLPKNRVPLYFSMCRSSSQLTFWIKSWRLCENQPQIFPCFC